MTQSIRAPSGPVSSESAAFAHDGLVFELVQRGFKQPALHRIVVDNKNGHECPGGLNGARCAVSGHFAAGGLKGC
jgi:hypothetical protein